MGDGRREMGNERWEMGDGVRERGDEICTMYMGDSGVWSEGCCEFPDVVLVLYA